MNPVLRKYEELIMNLIIQSLTQAGALFLDASVYILFGLLVSGLLRVFLSPQSVARHLGKPGIGPVFKAAFLGIPIPLCSCGVLPAAVSLRKQGASKGATTAFLISTPESGVDSMAISYALLDPILTGVRPLAAFSTAFTAGIFQERLDRSPHAAPTEAPDLCCPVDGCCDGTDCPPAVHRAHHSLPEKLGAGLKFAFGEVWADIAGWFFMGLLLAGLITALVPSDLMGRYLGGGLSSMVLMLAAGIPLYICATASTPVAAALILKGVSPGAALVFLLVGPATNITSLTVLLRVMGKQAVGVYLAVIVGLSLACGLALDPLYSAWGISAQATIGEARELIPFWAKGLGAAILLLISVRPLNRWLQRRLRASGKDFHKHKSHRGDSGDCSADCSAG